jgi:hypothetical protein
MVHLTLFEGYLPDRDGLDIRITPEELDCITPDDRLPSGRLILAGPIRPGAHPVRGEGWRGLVRVTVRG